MVIGDLLKTAANRLGDGTGDSYNEALVLLTIVLDCSKTYIYVNKNAEVSEEDTNKYFGYVQRRTDGEPIAYIAGRAWFMSHEFIVSPAVLVPRPETEGLVERAADLIKNEYSGSAMVLDLCTGSGCIGLSLASMFNDLKVHLSDIDEGALAIARMNTEKLGLLNRVAAIKSDLFESLGEYKYDLILSNPPYVAEGDSIHLEEAVRRHEPAIALFGGQDGYSFYRRIARESGSYLKPEGYLILEAGISQAESISAILTANGFKIADIQNDISGIPRIITAKKI